jgi:hypothetical protein
MCLPPLDTPIIPNSLSDIRVLTSLDVSNQAAEYGKGSIGIGADGAKHLAGALKDNA